MLPPSRALSHFPDLGLQTCWQDSNCNLQSTDIPLPNHCINH